VVPLVDQRIAFLWQQLGDFFKSGRISRDQCRACEQVGMLSKVLVLAELPGSAERRLLV
jgi:hypothetical protein